ncbi:MAG: NAD(P)/FAD-dependent oxidoreductase [Pseudomonadota bacterium]
MDIRGQSIVVLGAGLTGSLLAVMLAQRGARVTVLERAEDPRGQSASAGRSINLAMAARGMRGLRAVGLADQIQPLLCPMPGRILHRIDRTLQFQPYGTRETDINYSVNRAGLNHMLLDAAERAGAEIRFSQRCLDYDADTHELLIENHRGDPQTYRLAVERFISADGAGSPVRRSLQRQGLIDAEESLLEHRYQEIAIPATADGEYAMDPEGLHVWPRGSHMLIALPNPGGDFTATLFMPNKAPESEPSFAWWQDTSRARAFFDDAFGDVPALVDDLDRQLAEHPLGVMGTIHCSPWHVGDRCLLIGDAAHAIVPFHGQGMNAAFEDCVVLSNLIDESDSWQTAFADFSNARIPNARAIAQMALENYIEMRDSVRRQDFHLKKALALHLETVCPDVFVSRYSMVMFHADIEYAEALQRGKTQSDWLDTQISGKQSLDDIDLNACEHAARAFFQPL